MPLTPEIAQEIRRRYEPGHSLRRRAGKSTGMELAREFGVTPSCISNVIRRRSWRRVKPRPTAAS